MPHLLFKLLVVLGWVSRFILGEEGRRRSGEGEERGERGEVKGTGSRRRCFWDRKQEEEEEGGSSGCCVWLRIVLACCGLLCCCCVFVCLFVCLFVCCCCCCCSCVLCVVCGFVLFGLVWFSSVGAGCLVGWLVGLVWLVVVVAVRDTTLAQNVCPQQCPRANHALHKFW